MLKQDLILRNPLRILGEGQYPIKEGSFGGIIAKAGVGKTAFLVQLALDNLLKEKNVLHISLNQPVKKVCLWYEEVFHNISEEYQLTNTTELWETILPHRFIMTFSADDFSVSKLEERLDDLTEQGIFYPQMIIIDGLDFGEDVRETLSELKLMARERGVPVWFAVRVRPEEVLESGKVPETVAPVADLFDVLIGLKPSCARIDIMVLKGQKDESAPSMILDPSTLLIRNSDQGSCDR